MYVCMYRERRLRRLPFPFPLSILPLPLPVPSPFCACHERGSTLRRIFLYLYVLFTSIH